MDRNQGLQIVSGWSQSFDLKSMDQEAMQAIQIADQAFDVSYLL